MGHGSATTAVPFGSRFVIEHTGVTLFSGPVQGGDPQLLFVTVGEYPVIAEVVFSALVLPAGPHFGGLIETKLPLVPSVPEGPDVALLGLQTTIGPAGIVYHEDINGRTVNFRPRGILLPKSCPRGGFPFACASASAMTQARVRTQRCRVHVATLADLPDLPRQSAPVDPRIWYQSKRSFESTGRYDWVVVRASR